MYCLYYLKTASCIGHLATWAHRICNGRAFMMSVLICVPLISHHHSPIQYILRWRQKRTSVNVPVSDLISKRNFSVNVWAKSPKISSGFFFFIRALDVNAHRKLWNRVCWRVRIVRKANGIYSYIVFAGVPFSFLLMSRGPRRRKTK